MPQGRPREDLEKSIARLSIQYATPQFEPHVTLIGELAISKQDAITNTQRLAKMTKPFTIFLQEVTYLDEYFRCVFIKAERTEGLKSANLNARGLFKQNKAEEYMPHLSLVYGNLTLKQKEQVIKDIGRKSSTNFAVDRITLYYTKGQPNNWYPILEATLTGQKKSL